MAFVHLHLHTTYSICDAITQVGPIVKKAKEYGQNAVAMTDHGNMFGAIDFYKKAKANSIKPIIGCELYLSKSVMTDKVGEKGKKGYSHIILLAKNEQGYKNLVKLSSLAYTKGFYYKPRIDKATLFEYRDGLICLTACIAGSIQQLVLEDRINDAIQEAEWYQQTFGSDLYLEIQNHGIDKEKKVINFFKDLSFKKGIPLVATNDVHYLNKEDSEAHEVMLNIGSGKELTDPTHMKYDGGGYHFTSEQEMRELFPEFPNAIDVTQEIANKVDFDIDLKTHHFPKYEIPQGYDLDSYLEKVVYDGANKRFDNNISPEIKERLIYELGVIKQCGFSEYFLVVQDFVNWAKKKNIAVGPGRGSGAGSMVVYCLFITDVNPLEYDLFFERFLNPERVSMPDIDIDFCFFRRPEVIDYVINKYGKENVSSIITFGMLGAKSVINAVAKVMGLSFQDSQRISKLVLLPTDTLANNLEANEELKKALNETDINRKVLSISQKLEGCIKYSGIHASGIVVASGGIDTYVPLAVDKDGQLATQYDMESVDAAGMLKVDFLGLRTMTVVNETLRLVKMRRGIDININKIPLNDPNVYKSLAKGETSGVFQLESHGMRKLLNRIGLDDCNFRDLIALVALYRPGPLNSGMTDKFINRKRGYEPIVYAHPSLKGILDETYGVIVYQEQIMQIAVKLCGFTMGRGDVLRKAMGKKKKDVMDAMREEFVNGGIKTSGLSHEIMTQMFNEIEQFAAYGFNKSHSTCYALIAYWTAWLKVNYTVEFMASLLTSVTDKEDKVKEYFIEAKRLNIPVLLPDINESYRGFEVTTNGEIRYGMSAVRNLGDVAVDKIMEERNKQGRYISIEDFCSRVKVSKKVIESIIKCGALDNMGNRPQLLEIAPKVVDMCKGMQDNDEVSLLDFDDEYDKKKDIKVELPKIPDWTLEQKGKVEKEVLGLSISYNPLDLGKGLFRRSSVKIANLEDYIGTSVEIPAIVNECKSKTYSKGVMLILELMDDTGSVSAVAFDKARSESGANLLADNLVIVKGRVDNNDDKIQILIDKARIPTKDELENSLNILTISMDGKLRKHIDSLQTVFANNQGDVPVQFLLNGNIISSDVTVCLTDQLILEIKAIGFQVQNG